MQYGKFITQFVLYFITLFIIVWLGTAFDNKMTFSWYSYTIVGILSAFAAWTKSVNLNNLQNNNQHKKHVVHHKDMSNSPHIHHGKN